MKPVCSALFALISMLDLARVKADETTYFLVAEPPGRLVHNDSYALPLSKQEDIDHARYLISLGNSVFSGSHLVLVVANIGPGKDGINRNFLDPQFPKWSWQVSQFLGFGDATIEILDGSPTQMEWFD